MFSIRKKKGFKRSIATKKAINPGVACISKTDRGCVRDLNEDCIAFLQASDEYQAKDKGYLAIVADGMGGHSAGEIASQMAVEEVADFYYNSTKSPQKSLNQAFQAANEKIWQEAQSRADRKGMGTTCTALAIKGSEAVFTHIGDSRIYLLRENHLAQITEDHTLANKLRTSNVNLKEVEKVHQNILYKAMGTHQSQTFQSPKSRLKVLAGDRFLLCSDGLYDQITELEISQLLGIRSLILVANCMIALAKERGGQDNISVVILEIKQKSIGQESIITKEIQIS